MPTVAHLSVFAVALAAGGCAAVLPDEPDVGVHLGLELADKYVHRGMPQNRVGVAQGTFEATVPLRWGDSLTIGTFANLDLSSSTGSAWMPGGHAGRVSEFDLIATYAHSFGDVDVAAGLQNYTPPYGESFPNGPREQTNELFVHVGAELLGARPELQIRKDVDQAEGTYLQLGVSEDFPLGGAWTLVLGSHLGWSSKSQSGWNYGLRTSGFADLQGSARVLYAVDKFTTVGVSLNASTMVDSGLSDWFDLIGVEEDNLWVTVFVDWRF